MMDEDKLIITEIEFDDELYQKNIRENDYSEKAVDEIGGEE